jgi:type IV pilus assembly protein PilM
MSPAFKKNPAGAQGGGRPPAAIEIAPEGVLAAARPAAGGSKNSGDDDIFSFAPLAAGALIPGIDEPNLRNAGAVSAAIGSALGDVSPRTRAVTVVLPDSVVRVFVLDFDTLPDKDAEALSVVRFRLRKMVPFDVEHAGVSFQVITKDETGCKLLAAVLPGPILAEYEAAVRAAGYEPGAVLPSSLAALEAADMEAFLAANLSAHAITTSIANGQDLLLYRSIDLPAEPAHRIEEIQRAIAVAVAYFEDKLGARPRRLHYAGIFRPADFAQWIADPELTVVEWAPRPDEGNMTALPQINFAGVAGALAGAG